MTLLLFLLVGSMLITVHELGHYVFAKLFGVKVHEFMIGFGPKLVSKVRGGTQYTLRAIPLGGGVRLQGHGVERDRHELVAHDSLLSKPYWQKLLIVAGGPLFNFVLAILIFFVILWVVPSPPVVHAVLPNTPAEAAGFHEGDKILSLDEQRITSKTTVQDVLAGSDKSIMNVVVNRQGEKVTLQVGVSEEAEKRLGIELLQYETISPQDAARISLEEGVHTFKTIGTELLGSLQGTNQMELTGPIGIANLLREASVNGIDEFLFVIGIISLNLAFFNMLPLPLLDGGQILTFTYEALSGRRVKERTGLALQIAGVVTVLAVIIIATYNDISGLLLSQ